MNLAILFLHHTTNAVVRQNLESIARHNPGATLITVADGEPVPGGYSLAGTPELAKLHAHNKAHSSDWLVCSWFEQRRERLEAFDKLWLCEWDTYCTTSVADFYRPVWEFPFVTPAVARRNREPDWYWFSQMRDLPEGYRDFAIGAPPFLYLMSAAALSATCRTLLREPTAASNGELRFPTAANRAGFPPCGYTPPGDQITWMPLASVDLTQKAIWHPVKHLVPRFA